MTKTSTQNTKEIDQHLRTLHGDNMKAWTVGFHSDHKQWVASVVFQDGSQPAEYTGKSLGELKGSLYDLVTKGKKS